MFSKKFFDENWNFDNSQFVKLLEQARKQKYSNVKQKKGGSKEITLFNSVSRKELWQFLNKLSIFINSWVDIKWALNILSKQVKNPFLKKIAIEIKDNMDHGISISETMGLYPKVFDTLTVSLIEVWEKTWKLWSILQDLDKSLLETIELKWKVKGAMIYPMVLLFLTICMVVFMMVFIVPRITESFAKAGAELPWLTQFIVNVSDFFRNDWLKLIWYLIVTFVSLKLIWKTQAWKIFFAKLFVKMPIFWFIVKQSNIVYFIKSFTILLDSWVLLLESMRTASKVVPNLLYKRELIRIKNEVEIGLTISKSLWLNLEYESSVYQNPLFSEEFAYVVSTWEETWSLSDSLKKIWANYNWELKRYIGNLSSMMEPFIIVIVWALVGTIVVGIMLPFFNMGEVAKDL
jgi:type IV pilus assembly protein PilC